ETVVGDRRCAVVLEQRAIREVGNLKVSHFRAVRGVATDDQAGTSLRIFVGCGVSHTWRVGDGVDRYCSRRCAAETCSTCAQCGLHTEAESSARAVQISCRRKPEAGVTLGHRDEGVVADRRRAIMLE